MTGSYSWVSRFSRSMLSPFGCCHQTPVSLLPLSRNMQVFPSAIFGASYAVGGRRSGQVCPGVDHVDGPRGILVYLCTHFVRNLAPSASVSRLECSGPHSALSVVDMWWQTKSATNANPCASRSSLVSSLSAARW